MGKYRRFEKRHKNIAVHCSPAFNVKEGDIVTIGQCRPLSKTVRFNVVGHEPAVNAQAGKKNISRFLIHIIEKEVKIVHPRNNSFFSMGVYLFTYRGCNTSFLKIE